VERAIVVCADGKSRGYGFVEFMEDKSAQDAVQSMVSLLSSACDLHVDTEHKVWSVGSGRVQSSVSFLRHCAKFL
jgi:RNA recognition motif-containing protein